MGWGKQREGGAPSLSELDEERKTKRSYEKAVREGNRSREILLGEPPRDPVSWRAGHRDPRESAFRISAGGGAGPGAPALSTHRPHSSLQSPRGASPSLPGSPVLEPGPEWKPGVGVGGGVSLHKTNARPCWGTSAISRTFSASPCGQANLGHSPPPPISY